MYSHLKALLCFLILFADVHFCQTEIPIGVFGAGEPLLYNSEAFNSLKNSGINYIISESRTANKSYLQPYNVIAMNGKDTNDVIHHYSNGMYTKWEAEKDVFAPLETGFKHALVSPGSESFLGRKETYKGAVCWSTDTLSSPVDNWLTGPNYYQDKQYRLNYNPSGVPPNKAITFTVNFRMALSNLIPSTDPSANVCRIYIVHGSCYTKDGDSTKTYVYHEIKEPDGERMLKVSDFPSNGGFRTFQLTYTYPDSLLPDNISSNNYDDALAKTGIEFRVDWKGIGKLYIDYVEVFDNAIWGNYLTDSSLVKQKIRNYLTSYSDWKNIKYWYCIDEPQSIDYYYPIKHVQEILTSINPDAKLITEFMPQWHGQKNGDRTIMKFKELAQPKKLMIDYYPFAVGVSDEFYLARFSERLQELSKADPNFWYTGQGFGQKPNLSAPDYCGWRKPTPEELNASVMLALAHGAKGIMFWKYFTEDYSNYSATCKSGPVYYDCIVGMPNEHFPPGPLWFYLHDNLAPRLKGNLGNILLNLDYTGKFIQVTRNISNPGKPDSVTQDYLTLISNGTDYDFHAGLFTHHSKSDDKFFMLVNLRTDGSREVKFSITNNSGYKTSRVSDYENPSLFDKVITSKSTFILTLPAGEGRLFQLTPVLN